MQIITTDMIEMPQKEDTLNLQFTGRCILCVGVQLDLRIYMIKTESLL
jgi:hypothetical protein